MSGIEVGTTFDIAVSHMEERKIFFASEEEIKKLAANGQIASQYVNFDNEATSEFKFNPNGSSYAIEGILSPDGRVFGKMELSFLKELEKIFTRIFTEINIKISLSTV